MRSELRGLASLALLWIGACGADAVGPERAGVPQGSACEPLNATQLCSCGAMPGRQVCTPAGWDACRCAQADTSTAGSGGSGGDSGSASGSGGAGGAVGPTPDGNSRADLVFDWARSEGPTGPCEPGVYAGSYACDYIAAQFPPPGLHVEGLVNITLVEGDTAEVLVISDGTLAGNAFLFIGFTSELSGQLTCANDEFEATAVNGMITVGGTFHGSLEGELDRATQTLMGTWALSVDGAMPGMDMGTCAGAWTAVRQP